MNGLKVLYQEIRGNNSGMDFVFFCYYYSDSSGATQVVLYTTVNLANEYKYEADNFLNGLTVQ